MRRKSSHYFAETRIKRNCYDSIAHIDWHQTWYNDRGRKSNTKEKKSKVMKENNEKRNKNNVKEKITKE